MAKVVQFKKSRFFTVEIRHQYPRYFNGRKFTVTRGLTHFVSPHAHSKNFTDVSVLITFDNGRDIFKCLRYSLYTMSAKEQAR